MRNKHYEVGLRPAIQLSPHSTDSQPFKRKVESSDGVDEFFAFGHTRFKP